jgi:hypothetical protein
MRAIVLTAALIVAVLGTHWHRSTIEREHHAELVARLAQLEQTVIAQQEPRAAALNVYLPVPGLGEVKFSAEVPSEDITTLIESVKAVPGTETISKWLFSSEKP